MTKIYTKNLSWETLTIDMTSPQQVSYAMNLRWKVVQSDKTYIKKQIFNYYNSKVSDT